MPARLQLDRHHDAPFRGLAHLNEPGGGEGVATADVQLAPLIIG